MGCFTSRLSTMNPLAYHILSEPGPSSGIDIDADPDIVQGCTEKVNTVPASKRLVRHALLHRIHTSPGGRIGSCQANTFSAVAQTGKSFIGDTLVRRATIGAIVAESAMRHVPAMQPSTGCQDVVPDERRKSTGGTFMIDQLEELLCKLLRLR
jgi:hypothetical protein